MFTGIIEEKGKISGLADRGRSLTVSADILTESPVGASVAVNGACLTVVGHTEAGTRFDVIPETLSRTNLGALDIGDEVNLERAMPASGRFEGHIVQGHVDGTGTVTGLTSNDGWVVLEVDAPELIGEIVEKGSITVDGVSLTVASVTHSGFSVALIPHTLEVTTLGALDRDDQVNLETDILAKYLRKIVGKDRLADV
jgi:riboflavin synthase